MNSLDTFILIVILIDFSFGYKTDCTQDMGKPCTVYLTPHEDAYQELFLSSIDCMNKLVHDIGLMENETNLETIEKENENIKKFVGEDEIRTFINKLPDVTYGYNRSVEIVPHLHMVMIPSDISSFVTTEKPWTRKDFYEENGPEHNGFLRAVKHIFKYAKPLDNDVLLIDRNTILQNPTHLYKIRRT
uniref:Secreted protein n=1 Tax=Strongyloides venezuelensis TaxID=75913 RepID=A0A0K0FIT6_STRVS